MSPNHSLVRGPLSPELAELRQRLPQLLPILEADPAWYASISVQKKITRQFFVNTRQNRVSESFTTGLVLRIYDGRTMHESATDSFEWPHLEGLARALAAKVSALRSAGGPAPRPYRAPSWDLRLKSHLDPEILAQVPAGVNARTPVHFGVKFAEDPAAPSVQAWFSRGKECFELVKQCAAEAGFPEGEPSYVESRQNFATEESLFVDREVNLSQTLYRLMSAALMMNGEDAVHRRAGGLGGLECLRLPKTDIIDALRDLKALAHAERLKPGKYRVLFSPGLSGVLAHEAFGHSQEGDTCARGRSKAWDLYRSGESVGNEQATILNNPAIYANGVEPYAAWGSYFFDEEGWFAGEQVLLDRGRLCPPMTNLTSALRLGVPRSSNGKREDWSHGVYTRQTNTYFSAGDKTYRELLAQIEDGFVADESAGGMEDPKGMGIQVGIAYLKEVKGGRLTGRVFRGPARGDIQMTGYTPDILKSIVAKSKIEHHTDAADSVMHPFNEVGGCGKYHKEVVAAGCGGPYMLLDQVILG